MSYKISCVAIILSSLAIIGCASRASSIAPIAIPSANYKGLSCEETKSTLEVKRAQKFALVEQQNNAATGDAVGVFFILLPLGSIFGDAVEGELAQAKGEVLALQGAVPINCREDRVVEGAPEKHKERISVRLENVKALLKDGLITQKEADNKRKTILDAM